MFGLQPTHLTILFLTALRCIVPLVLIVAVVFLVVWLVRRQPFMPTLPASSTMPATPADVLKMRYAKGEITKEQFDQMKKDVE